MNVQELFKRMSFAEFSNLTLGTEGAGMIDEKRQSALFHYLNEALTKLHARFLLKENELTVLTFSHITKYDLIKQHAITAEAKPGVTQFIYDSINNPFQGDVIKVLRVMGQNGLELPLNDDGKRYSLFTPRPNRLQIPYPDHGTHINVVYQAKHPYIEYGDLCAQIDLPEVLESALTSYIAGGVYGNMNGQEHTVKGQEHMLKYEAHCQQVIEMDLVSNSTSTTTEKFDDRGFV